MRIVGVDAYDIRFPTSRVRAGSDAMNKDPDYSLAYVILRTDDPLGLSGHGFTFTIGRGNELCVEGIRSYAPFVMGCRLEELTGDMRGFSRSLTNDSQLRWLGPEKGVVQMSAAAIINAVWDLHAKTQRKPLWKLVVDMEPKHLVDSVDFTYIADFLTEEEALDVLERLCPTKGEREQVMWKGGYPAYTTSAGWYGYSDGEIRQLLRAGLADGWTHFKLKVGRDIETDLRRLRLVREQIGPDGILMLDANQVWEVREAIEHIGHMSQFNPWWMEEPTSPDDVLGYKTIADRVAPVRLAAGEHCQNRIIFKQLLQLNAIAFCQVDACRVGGLNEVLAIMLMAAKAGVPVCPHAGGVGLPEYVQHLALVDYIAISGSLDGRTLEYVDHLHEHFVDPAVVRQGRYQVPLAPGYSATLHSGAIAAYQFPRGEVWNG